MQAFCLHVLAIVWPFCTCRANEELADAETKFGRRRHIGPPASQGPSLLDGRHFFQSPNVSVVTQSIANKVPHSYYFKVICGWRQMWRIGDSTWIYVLKSYQDPSRDDKKNFSHAAQLFVYLMINYALHSDRDRLGFIQTAFFSIFNRSSRCAFVLPSIIHVNLKGQYECTRFQKQCRQWWRLFSFSAFQHYYVCWCHTFMLIVAFSFIVILYLRLLFSDAPRAGEEDQQWIRTRWEFFSIWGFLLCSCAECTYKFILLLLT